MPSNKTLYAIFLALIVVLGIALSMKTVLGSGTFIDFWDDSYYIYFSHYIANYGFNHIEFANFATEYILVGVPAILFRLFGISLLTEGMFSMFCLVGTIISIFLIGKLLHNELAGVLSALTFILVPLVAAEGAASGDNMAVAFFATLAVLLLLLGAKRRQPIYYALLGFVGIIGVLAGSALNIIIFVFLVPYLLYLLLKYRNRKQLACTLLFFAGILMAIALIMALGYTLQSHPLIYFTTNYHAAEQATSQTPTFLQYVSILFPFRSAGNGIRNWFFWPFILDFGNGANTNVMGFFGYAMLSSVLYLLARRKYNVLIPVSWFVLLLLYLSFGKDSLSGGYVLFVGLFSIILIPAIAVIIGLALSMLVEGAFPRRKLSKGRRQRAFYNKIVLFIAIAAYILIVANSLMLMNFIHISNYALTYQWQQVADVLLSLPHNASIYMSSGLSQDPGIANYTAGVFYGAFNNTAAYIRNSNFLNWMAIEAYGHYNVDANFSAVFSNCSNLKGDYIVEINASFYKNNLPTCSNLSIYFSPKPDISLSQYEEHTGGSQTQFTIYKRNP